MFIWNSDVINAHIHLQWNATNNSNKQQKFNHSKSNMSREKEEDDELDKVTIAAAVVAVTARDHAPRRRNVIGWNKFASWIFFNTKINTIISLKQLQNCFSVLFLFRFRCKRVWNKTEIKLFYFSFISHASAVECSVFQEQPRCRGEKRKGSVFI